MEEELEIKENETVKFIKDSEIDEITSYWTCDACGGDSDSGCLMSDPQNCVRG
jgi:hypothetical protein